MTNKEEADFGDLIKLVDGKVKEVVADIEAKEEWNQLQEFSKVAGSQVQNKLTDLMGENAGDFKQIQEVATKEIVSLIQSREYGIGDLFFLLKKLCTSFGLGMNPAVMAILPLNVLVQAILDSIDKSTTLETLLGV